jgi:hypothetical protein
MVLLRVLPRRFLPLVTLVEALLLARRFLASRRASTPSAGDPVTPRTIKTVNG